MEIAAVRAIADLARMEQSDVVAAAYGTENLSFGGAYIIPKPFDPMTLAQQVSALLDCIVSRGDDGCMTHDLLETYDRQLRGESEVIGSSAWDQDGPVWRATYGFGGMVTYRSLEHVGGAELDALVHRSVGHFFADPAVDSVEWKTRSHDLTDDLHGRLLRAGFEPEGEETIMLGEAEALLAAAVEPPAGIVVRRVDQLADRVALLEAAADMQVSVFGRGGSGADLLARVERSEGLTEVWVAESPDGVVVSAG
eukprot:gene36603-41429_t